MDSILGASGIGAGFTQIYNPLAISPTPKEFIYMFYFLNIHTDGNSPNLVIDSVKYSDYNDFINFGILPLTDQSISVSDSTGSVQIKKTLGEIEVNIQLVDRPLPSTIDSQYVVGKVEVWARYLDANGNIPASRIIDTLIKNPQGNFLYSGGNPANRTYKGVLQSNGFYKSIFNINLPTLGSNLFTPPVAQLLFKARVHPYAIPPSANIQT